MKFIFGSFNAHNWMHQFCHQKWTNFWKKKVLNWNFKEKWQIPWANVSIYIFSSWRTQRHLHQNGAQRMPMIEYLIKNENVKRWHIFQFSALEMNCKYFWLSMKSLYHSRPHLTHSALVDGVAIVIEKIFEKKVNFAFDNSRAVFRIDSVMHSKEMIFQFFLHRKWHTIGHLIKSSLKII